MTPNTAERKGMAIKVIEKGRMTGGCPLCGCKFEYSAEDIKEGVNMSGNFFNRKIYEYRYVRCPECKTKLKISR